MRKSKLTEFARGFVRGPKLVLEAAVNSGWQASGYNKDDNPTPVEETGELVGYFLTIGMAVGTFVYYLNQ